mmetsp:Transcript_31598/g.71835  ORF Transcript_31598/g.71835 Transcript_31598/m.71835 type:complete len:278 (+) Transcript_31598:73-906(+)
MAEPQAAPAPQDALSALHGGLHECLAKKLAKSIIPTPHMERSAGMWADPKFKDLHVTLRSHGPDPPPLAERHCPIRTGGRDLVDARVKDTLREMAGQRHLAVEHGAPGLSRMRSAPLFTLSASLGPSSSFMTQPPGAGDSLASTQLPDTRGRTPSASSSPRNPMERFDSIKTRHRLRVKTDQTLKRLFVDMDLARDKRQQPYGDKSRCEHLDKVFDWYQIHNLEEKRERRESPAYLVYKADAPVSPGSLRVPCSRNPSVGRHRGLELTASSPALLSS